MATIILANFNDTNPAAPVGYDNITWSVDRSNPDDPDASGHVARATTTKYGTIIFDASASASKYLGADGIWHNLPTIPTIPTLYEKFGLTWNGVLGNSTCLVRQKIGPNPLTILANFANWNLFGEANATGSTAFNILVNGVSIGTATVGAGAAIATFSSRASLVVNVGDILKVVGPATPDATFADIGGAAYLER